MNDQLNKEIVRDPGLECEFCGEPAVLVVDGCDTCGETSCQLMAHETAELEQLDPLELPVDHEPLCEMCWQRPAVDGDDLCHVCGAS
jgi:hypothetical protein